MVGMVSSSVEVTLLAEWLPGPARDGGAVTSEEATAPRLEGAAISA